MPRAVAEATEMWMDAAEMWTLMPHSSAFPTLKTSLRAAQGCGIHAPPIFAQREPLHLFFQDLAAQPSPCPMKKSLGLPAASAALGDGTQGSCFRHPQTATMSLRQSTARARQKVLLQLC